MSGNNNNNGGGGTSGGGGNRRNNSRRGSKPTAAASNNNNSNNTRGPQKPPAGRRPETNTRRPPANNNSNANNANNNSNSANKKRNGEKGAESHTVSETERIRFTVLLMDLREGESDEPLELPTTLTNTERKFIHELALQLGLVSKSTGKGENRRIRVTKRNNRNVKKGGADNDSIEYPVLNIGRKGVEALKQHVTRHPPTRSLELESHETGLSLVQALTQQQQQQGDDDGDDGGDNVATTLNQLGLGVSKAAPAVQRRHKRVDLKRRKSQHAAAQTHKLQHADYQNMVQQRSRLPAHAHAAQVVATVRKHAVTIVSGETGCGKSTQVPQFLLDADATASIVVTQPRRISAISIAERVAQEQCQPQAGGLIGYQVRLESACCADTQLLFLTPGVLLRRLQSSPMLQEFNYILIDEIHERDKYTEFLLITLRDLLPRRPDLRVVLMSATLQTQALVDYFWGNEHVVDDELKPALVEMKGRTFPVQEFFLEKVLEMTGYVDATTSYDAAAMQEHVETELAKLTQQRAPPQQREQQQLGQQGQPKQQQRQTDSSLKCVMCGRGGFADAIELGGHIGLCDGQMMDFDDVEGDSAAPVSDGAFDFGTFDDYDVNEAPLAIDLAEFDGHDVQGFNGSAAAAVAVTVTNGDAADAADPKDIIKWDGTSAFEVANDTAVGVTETEEDLLNQYQAMHDDEQVDTMLLMEVMHYIVKSSYGDGAILVFFPGWQEISEFTLMLESTAPFRDRSKYSVLPLHSGIPSKDQRKVLQRPPRGVRKIILSTNIAETSLTIEDVAFVVDTGRSKEKAYDPHLKTSTLQPTWISQASSKQRKGRAGRTKAGVCFHLFSSLRHASMRPFVESELLRTPLEEMCLMCKVLNLAPGGPEDKDGIPAFLGKAMSAPHTKSVSNALELLVDLGAMEPETNSLTKLGQCLSTLTLEPRVGKMVIWSYLLGCSRVTSSMGVAMSYKSPFVLPPASMRRNADQAKVQMSQNSESDQITVYHALAKRDELVRNPRAYNDFCRRSFIGTSTMQMVSDLRKNLTRELSSLGFPNPATRGQYHTRHDNDHALWQAAIAAGLYPNVASRRRGDVNFSTMTNRKAKIHVSSVNAIRGQPLNAKCLVPEGEVEFICFGEMVKGKVFFTMNQTTHLASPLPLLLLCGTSLSVRPQLVPEGCKTSILDVDNWIMFQCDEDTASRIVILRKRLESAFWHAISNPAAGLSNLTAAERDAVEILGTVLQSAHKSAPTR